MTNLEWLRTWPDSLLLEYLPCGTAHCPPPDGAIEYVEEHPRSEDDCQYQTCMECWLAWLDAEHRGDTY